MPCKYPLANVVDIVAIDAHKAFLVAGRRYSRVCVACIDKDRGPENPCRAPRRTHCLAFHLSAVIQLKRGILTSETRQFPYCDHQGLVALRPFRLHELVARVLESRVLHTMKIPDVDIIENAFIDNLLNFAGSPRGVALLQNTGAMDRSVHVLPRAGKLTSLSPILCRCVAYMVDRFRRKVHVSKYDRFGYGVMVTQVGTTLPGMEAIERAGLVEFLLAV